MISRDFFSVANNLGDSVAFNLESDTRRTFARRRLEKSLIGFAETACEIFRYLLGSGGQTRTAKKVLTHALPVHPRSKAPPPEPSRKKGRP